MDTVLTAAILIIALVGVGIISYALVLMLDQTRKVGGRHFATYQSRIVQVTIMYAIVLFLSFATMAFQNGEKWPALGFLAFVALATMAVFPALFRKQFWNEHHLFFEWPFLRRTKIRWDDIVSAKATNFPERIVFNLTDGKKATFWTEHHLGVQLLAKVIHERLGDRFKVGLFSNLHEFHQDLWQRRD